MFDVDYTSYLSVDNGKGLLLNKNDIYVLEKYNFDYKKYSNLSSLIFDINSYLSDVGYELEDLEEVLINISEMHYYKDINK